jgi:Tfp pilus assembly protein FimT
MLQIENVVGLLELAIVVAVTTLLLFRAAPAVVGVADGDKRD